MDIVDLDMGQLVYLGQAAFAMVLGGLIGWERDRSGKPAGLRTHMLVAGSASLLVSLSHIGIGVFAAQLGRPVAGGDPIRVVQTIITGFSVQTNDAGVSSNTGPREARYSSATAIVAEMSADALAAADLSIDRCRAGVRLGR